MKRYLLWGVVALVIGMTWGLLHWKQISSGLELVTCQPNSSNINTPIHFFVTDDVLDVMSQSQVRESIQRRIDMSNTILTNSCIPLHREVKTITYVDFSDEYLFDFGSVHFALERAVGTQTIGKIRQTINEFYAVLLGPDNTIFDSQWLGTSEMTPDGRFIALAYNAPDYTLEHELGHLAGADHDELTIEEQALYGFEQIVPLWDQKQLKPYARAALCGDAGTVMSYHQNILPIYSQPNIRYQGQNCGDAHRANNSRVLTEFSQRLQREFTLGHWVPAQIAPL